MEHDDVVKCYICKCETTRALEADKNTQSQLDEFFKYVLPHSKNKIICDECLVVAKQLCDEKQKSAAREQLVCRQAFAGLAGSSIFEQAKAIQEGGQNDCGLCGEKMYDIAVFSRKRGCFVCQDCQMK